jgi:tRNA isopentenyl-2-thiomethyl-A-37 hydroxylase MiaE
MQSNTAILALYYVSQRANILLTLLPELKQFYSLRLLSFMHAYQDYLILWNVQITQCNVQRTIGHYAKYKPFFIL